MDELFAKIEAIQKKPLHVRKRILFASTGIIGGLFFLLWLSLFPSTLSKIEHRTASIATGTSPFAALMGTVREAGKGLSVVADQWKSETRYIKENGPDALHELVGEAEKMASTSPATTSPKESQE